MPWARPFHESTFPAFRRVLPDQYLARLGTRFRAAAEAMAIHAADPEIARDWLIVATYLNSASSVLEQNLGLPEGQDDQLKIRDRPPSITPYREVAAAVSANGAARLASAGYAVADAIGPAQNCPLDADQLELLQELADGQRVIDVARAAGFSERSVYRQMQDVWRKIGVENRSEAIALAVREGWI